MHLVIVIACKVLLSANSRNLCHSFLILSSVLRPTSCEEVVTKLLKRCVCIPSVLLKKIGKPQNKNAQKYLSDTDTGTLKYVCLTNPEKNQL